MAVLIGNKSTITVGGSAVGKVKAWNYTTSDQEVDVTTYDSTAKEFVAAGLPGAKLSVDALFDLADVGQDALRTAFSGAAVAIVLYPEGSTAGKPKFTGNLLLSSHEFASADGAIDTKFSGSLDGPLTEGTA